MLEGPEQTTFLSTLLSGGPVMIPLLACSLAALAVIIERLFWGPTIERAVPQQFAAQAQSLIASGKIDELVGLCRANDSSIARMLLVGLKNRERSRSEIIGAMESVGRQEAFVLQRRLGLLGTVAAVSPLLGLLGTVFGMISTFHVISEHGTGNPGLMAGGIAEALITTATGLTIAVPSLLFYRYFVYRTRQLVVELESLALVLVDDLLTYQTHGNARPVAEALHKSR